VKRAKASGSNGNEARVGGAVREPIAVYLVEPDAGRPPFTSKPPLEYLPADAPLPRAGDLILLPPVFTGDSEAEAFAWCGTLSPFRVLEVEHVYYRDKAERPTPVRPGCAQYVRTMILVARLSPEQFEETPGRALAPWAVELSASGVR
jgi:hypothetical protein